MKGKGARDSEMNKNAASKELTNRERLDDLELDQTQILLRNEMNHAFYTLPADAFD